MAILDYLQRSHPGDSDTLTMVSLHFTMYRQIGDMLEEGAKKGMKQLLVMPLGKYDSVFAIVSACYLAVLDCNPRGP